MRLRVAVREAQEKKGLEVSALPSPSGPHTHGTVSNRLDCTLIALSYPSSFLDIAFHLLLRTAFIGWLTPRMPRKDGQRRLMHVCVCGYGSGFNGVLQLMGREPHVSQQRLFQGPLLAML
jgi:hypothetical protein